MSNTFYANTNVEVITTSKHRAYHPIKTNLSYIDAINYLAYYREDGKSFKESIKLIERL